ncbi:MAG: hypothetical protein ACM31D_04720 [Bacteroidota bacterium]
METFSPIPNELYRRRLSMALRLQAGTDKPLTVDMLATAMEMLPRTTRAHYDGETGAQGHDLLSYMKLLGPDFSNAILALCGLTVARLTGEHITPAQAIAEIAEGLAELSKAAKDGIIDHREAPDVIRELEEGGRSALALAAQLRQQFGLGEN